MRPPSHQVLEVGRNVAAEAADLVGILLAEDGGALDPALAECDNEARLLECRFHHFVNNI